eukprot:1162149-Pelagomonas_calceolata.AAC.6
MKLEDQSPRKMIRQSTGEAAMCTHSLLLAKTTELRPESTVPTSSAVNSQNSWNPAKDVLLDGPLEPRITAFARVLKGYNTNRCSDNRQPALHT